jgi:hypothetical protein
MLIAPASVAQQMAPMRAVSPGLAIMGDADGP